MKDEDFDSFIKLLPHMSMGAKDDATVRQFAREYRQETIELLAWLCRLGLAGGVTSLHPAPPTACGLCSRELSRYAFFVHGQTDIGVSADLCFLCFAKHGEGIGWGIGQLYWAVENGDWRLIAGGDPAASDAEAAE